MRSNRAVLIGNVGVIFVAISISYGAQPDITKPATPGNLSATSASCSQVNLSWSASVDPINKQSETVSGIKGYNIYRSGLFWKLVTTTSTSDTGLLGNVSYSYQVSAVDNASNESALSALSTTRTLLCPDIIPPAVPGNLVATALDCGRASLSWNPASDAPSVNQQVSGVKGYNLYRNGSFVTFTANLSITDLVLSGNSNYSYRIAAVDNANNESAMSIAAGLQTQPCPDATAPNVPIGLLVTGLSCSQVSFSWTPSADAPNSNQQVSGLRGYNVYRNGYPVEFTVNPIFSENNLAANTLFYYRVSSVDNAGNESAPSNPLNVTTPSCPAQPATNLRISVSDRKAQLQWSGTSGVGYQLQCSTALNGPWAPVDAPTTNFAVTNIALGSACVYRVAIWTNSPYYLANALVNGKDRNPPTAPGFLTLNALPGAQVALSWPAATDVGTTDGSGQTIISGLDRYLIYRDGVFLKSEPGGILNSLDGSASPGRQYTYSVAAIDQAGNVSARVSSSVDLCVFLQPSNTTIGPDATNNSFVVNASGCSWNASVPLASTWIQLQGATTGNGTATINYSVASNPDLTDRTGTVVVENNAYTITQKGRKCTYSLSPLSLNHGDIAAVGNFAVTVASGCNWTAASSDSWIHTTTSGNGSGTVTYVVDSNSSSLSRSGRIVAGDQSFTVNQGGAPCIYVLNPTSTGIDSTFFSGTFGVTAPQGCNWSPMVTNSWIHVTSGSGIVNYTVDANTATASRSGTISVSGQIFTVTQSGTGCNYSLNPTNLTVSAAATSGNITVSATSGCIWSAASTNSWVHTTTSGVGNGSVIYALDANISPNARVGIITIAGRTFTVTQAAGAGCSYGLASIGAGFSSGGGSSNVLVTAGSGCAWSAASGASWLTITAGANGNGNGFVSYSVAANASAAARTGTISVAGQNYSVTQSGNQAPLANAGTDITITLGSQISFTAAGSSDPDGSITSYQWTFGDGFTASGFSVTHAYSILGLYTATLTVTDNLGATATDSALIRIMALPDTTPPTINITSPVSGAILSNTVTMAASASDNLAGSGIARVEFYCDSATTPLGSSTNAPYSFNCDTTLMTNGNHTFFAKAYDVAANVANSPSVTVTVNNLVAAPAAWTKRFGGTANDSGSAVAVDLAGNVLLAGSFKGSSDFGGSLLTSAGGADIVLAKYNSAGIHQWSYRFGSTGDETVKAMALDGSGNIFIVGYFTGTAGFGGTTFTSTGQYNAFVAKYSASGQHLWSKSFGSIGSTTYIDLFNSVAVDSQGNVVVAGTFQGDASFGGATLHSQWGTAVNTVLAKYSSDGAHLWSQTFASGNENYANGVAIDRNDNILLTGSFFSSVNFASNEGLDRTITTVYPTYQNIFLAKFTKDGTHLWSKRYGGAKGDKGISVSLDGNGDVVVGGMFYHQTDLGNGIINGSALDLDAFVAKYSGVDGAFQWAKSIVGDNGCWVNTVKVDGQNNIVLLGFFYGTFNFGGQALTSVLNSYDGYVAKYTGAGALAWVASQGGPGSDGGTAMTIDGTSHPIVTGAFNGTATIGGTNLVSLGVGDAFLMKLNP